MILQARHIQQNCNCKLYRFGCHMKFERSQFKSVPLTDGQLDQDCSLHIMHAHFFMAIAAVAVVRSTLFQDPGKPPPD